MQAIDISDTLELLSNAHHAKARGRDVDTLRGVRGTPDGEIARIAASTWLDDRPVWPRDQDELRSLFLTAFEDGMVAIALAGALLPDHPAAIYELGLDWLDRVDDVLTADALGSIVLGPGLLATGGLADLLSVARAAPRPHARRAAVLAALPATGRPVTGPCMSALRQRAGDKHIRFVEAPRPDVIEALMTPFVRDTSPIVHKGLRRVLREWRKADKDQATTWANGVPGGIPKTLRAELGGKKKR